MDPSVAELPASMYNSSTIYFYLAVKLLFLILPGIRISTLKRISNTPCTNGDRRKTVEDHVASSNSPRFKRYFVGLEISIERWPTIAHHTFWMFWFQSSRMGCLTCLLIQVLSTAWKLSKYWPEKLRLLDTFHTVFINARLLKHFQIMENSHNWMQFKKLDKYHEDTITDSLSLSDEFSKISSRIFYCFSAKF